MSQTEDFNYLPFATPTVAAGDLAQLAELAEKQHQAEEEVKRIEADLAAAREKLNQLSEHQIPSLMDELGLQDFKTSSGLKVLVKETIRASIPAARAIEAYAWLRANKHGALIKRAVSVVFSTGEDELADKLLAEISEQGLEAEDKASVHAQTLAAFVREQLAEGNEIPMDLLGVHRQRVSQIKF